MLPKRKNNYKKYFSHKSVHFPTPIETELSSIYYKKEAKTKKSRSITSWNGWSEKLYLDYTIPSTLQSYQIHPLCVIPFQMRSTANAKSISVLLLNALIALFRCHSTPPISPISPIPVRWHNFNWIQLLFPPDKPEVKDSLEWLPSSSLLRLLVSCLNFLVHSTRDCAQTISVCVLWVFVCFCRMYTISGIILMACDLISLLPGLSCFVLRDNSLKCETYTKTGGNYMRLVDFRDVSSGANYDFNLIWCFRCECSSFWEGEWRLWEFFVMNIF